MATRAKPKPHEADYEITIRLNLVSNFLKVERFLELESREQLLTIDSYYDYVTKGVIPK
mgnify:CR=1 FL=1